MDDIRRRCQRRKTQAYGAFGRSLEQKPRGLQKPGWIESFSPCLILFRLLGTYGSAIGRPSLAARAGAPAFPLPARSGDGLTSRTTTHAKVKLSVRCCPASDSHKAAIACARPLWLAARLVADGATDAAHSHPCSRAARSPSMARDVYRYRLSRQVAAVVLARCTAVAGKAGNAGPVRALREEPHLPKPWQGGRQTYCDWRRLNTRRRRSGSPDATRPAMDGGDEKVHGHGCPLNDGGRRRTTQAYTPEHKRPHRR